MARFTGWKPVLRELKRSPFSLLRREVRRIVDDLDARGRWVSTYEGERLVGQPKIPLGSPYLSSQVFSRNLTALSELLMAEE